MSLDPATAEAVTAHLKAMRDAAESIRATADRLEAALLPGEQRPTPPRPAEARPPFDGEIRGKMIWVHDRWREYTKTIRRLLAFALGEGKGASWEQVCDYMIWARSLKPAENSVRRMNERILEEVGDATRWPQLTLTGGLRCEWEGPGVNAKESA